MQRRMLVTLTGAYALAGSMRSTASANNDQPSGGSDDLDAAFGNFLTLPGTKSYLIHVGQAGSLGHFAHQPHRYLFTASAYKTFVLAQNLRDLEAAAYSEDDQLNIDDNVRTVGSPVYLELSGTTPARSVLEP
jgi:beta-lactamase class A